VQFFYQGLTQSNRSMIESMNEGGFLSLTGDEAYRTLDQLSDNSQQWDFSSCRDKAAPIQKKGGIYEVKEDVELKMKIDALTKKVEALVVSKSMNAANPFHVDCCSICASPMHLAQTCPSLPAFVESPMEQVNAFNDYRKQSSGPFAESYNLGWRNHPNFSWKQNQPMTQRGAPHQSKAILNTPQDFISRFTIKAVPPSQYQHTKPLLNPLPLLHSLLWKTLLRPSSSSQVNPSMT
jgi:hypothetical protein